MKIRRFHVIGILAFILASLLFVISLQPSERNADLEVPFSIGAFFIGIIVVILCLGYLFLGLRAIAYALYYYFKGNSFDYHLDDTAFPELSEEAQQWESELLSNGFRYLGLYEAVNSSNKSEAQKSSVYVEDSQTIYAEILSYSSPKQSFIFVALISDYPDGFSYQTNYKHPYVLDEETEWLEIKTVQSSISAAYDYHAAQAKRHNQAHGRPKKIQKLADAMTSPEVSQERVRSLNLTVFLRYGLLVLLLFPILAAVLGLNTSFNFNPFLKVSVQCFLLSFMMFYHEAFFRGRTVESRKARKTKG
jgi:hypothetical protein